MPPLLVARDLAYTYPDGTEALAGLSFVVEAGERLAVVGANGAGKSTLLLCLCGLLLPQGELRLDGEQLAPCTARRWRARCGLVFQDPDDQLFMPTVLEDVMFGPRSQGLDYQRAQARALQALAALGAEHLAHRPPHHLSLGEKRRVAMAGILAMQPELIALDEPLAGLDPRGRAQLAHLLDQVPVTQIIATHDIAFARRWCATALILKAGRQLAWGSAAELLSDEELLRAAELNEE